MKKEFVILLSALSLLTPVLLTSLPLSSFAGSATWDLNPTSGDWNTATNWTPATVPNGARDVATFAPSNTLGVFVSANTEVSGITFNAGANSFTLTANPLITLTVSGGGITNNTSLPQNFVSADDSSSNVGAIVFLNHATAGSLTTFTNVANTTDKFDYGGATRFLGQSTADHATFENLGAAVASGFGGITLFADSAGAGSGIFVNEPGLVDGANGGKTAIDDSAHAADGVFTSNGATVSGANGGNVTFFSEAEADNATLIANGGSDGGGGGQIFFQENSAGNTCRIELFGNGFLDISFHFGPPLTIGSLEGDGVVNLGGVPLTVGSNNLTTTFSGLLQDNGAGSILRKVGTGTLTLEGSNFYSAGTSVTAGTLVVANVTGSAVGTGALKVNAGTLGGSGVIAGIVTVGTGSGTGAFLAPAHGTKQYSTLTIQSNLTFNSDATYTYSFKAKGKQANTDKVIANGVTIASGASFNMSGTTKGTLT
ncbi:MAG: autotransporter-associated beta strand repeat-containing protein, partial [Chthoniobacterales bacterium]